MSTKYNFLHTHPLHPIPPPTPTLPPRLSKLLLFLILLFPSLSAHCVCFSSSPRIPKQRWASFPGGTQVGSSARGAGRQHTPCNPPMPSEAREPCSQGHSGRLLPFVLLKNFSFKIPMYYASTLPYCSEGFFKWLNLCRNYSNYIFLHFIINIPT